MTPEIERAARAIGDLISRPRSGIADPAVVTIAPDDMARAVIASLLPPSPGMIEAAARALVAWLHSDPAAWDGMRERQLDQHRDAAGVIVTAALRAALGQPEGGRDGS